MKLEFTKTALWQLHLLSHLDSKETGFVFGCGLGKFKIIENLFSLRFNKKNIDRLYHQVFYDYGDRLMGVFFVNSEVFLNDWFLENFIFKITGHKCQIFFYHYDSNCHQKKCQPLLEL